MPWMALCSIAGSWAALAATRPQEGAAAPHYCSTCVFIFHMCVVYLCFGARRCGAWTRYSDLVGTFAVCCCNKTDRCTTVAPPDARARLPDASLPPGVDFRRQFRAFLAWGTGGGTATPAPRFTPPCTCPAGPCPPCICPPWRGTAAPGAPPGQLPACTCCGACCCGG